MKNVRTKQKTKGSSALSGVFGVILVAAVCIAGTYFATSAYWKNIQMPEEEKVEMMTVAVATEELPDGSYVKNDDKGISAYSMVERPVNEVPENAIVSAVDMDKRVTKLFVAPNTIITSDMLVGVDMDEEISSTSHQVAINYVDLVSKVEKGSYIDIMIKSFSTGESDGGYSNKIVLSKKKVLDVSGRTVYLNLDREEELQLGIATVEAARTEKDRKITLYAAALASPSQPKAIETYENAELAQLIANDPNLIRQAQEALVKQAEQNAEEQESNIETIH